MLFSSVSKVVFAVAVIVILAYIIYYMRSLQSNLGEWSIDGTSGGTLKFNKDGVTVFEVGKDIVSVGNLGIVNRIASSETDDDGVKFVDRTSSKTIANITPNKLSWPQAGMLIKSQAIDGTQRLEVYDVINKKSLWHTPAPETFQTSSDAASYF